MGTWCFSCHLPNRALFCSHKCTNLNTFIVALTQDPFDLIADPGIYSETSFIMFTSFSALVLSTFDRQDTLLLRILVFNVPHFQRVKWQVSHLHWVFSELLGYSSRLLVTKSWREEKRKKRMKMCEIHTPAPHEECNHYVLQIIKKISPPVQFHREPSPPAPIPSTLLTLAPTAFTMLQHGLWFIILCSPLLTGEPCRTFIHWGKNMTVDIAAH